MTEPSPIDTKAQDRALREKADRVDAAQLNEQADWQWLLADARGRRIVRNLIAYCGVYQTSFTGNSETFFREGRRAVGLMVTDKAISHSPDQYLAMLKEKSDG